MKIDIKKCQQMMKNAKAEKSSAEVEMGRKECQGKSC